MRLHKLLHMWHPACLVHGEVIWNYIGHIYAVADSEGVGVVNVSHSP